MKLTGHQIEAVKTWRKGNVSTGAIVSDLPFGANDKRMTADDAKWFGGRYVVGESMTDGAIDFILAAAKESANGTKTDV